MRVWIPRASNALTQVNKTTESGDVTAIERVVDGGITRKVS
jgi:hypothetical protein